MQRIYAIANQKGGVGKSTTTQILGAGLAKAGKKVLLIDLDPQSNLSSLVGAVTDAQDKNVVTMLEVLTEEHNIKEGIQHMHSYDIVPASMFLASVDGRIPNQLARPYRLQKALESIRGKYDYILIDTPPALGTLTNNALIAASEVIIPAQADVLSLQGVAQLAETISAAREHANPGLAISGIALTRYNGRARLSRELAAMFETAAKQLNTVVFKTHIREAVAVKEAQAAQQDIFSYAPQSNPAQDYAALIYDIFTIDIQEKEAQKDA
jgi:chromosome partitioning protein